MSDEISPQEQGRPQVVVVGPNGIAVGGQEDASSGETEKSITEMVEQPAKVMRIGSMIRQLLEEVKSAPLDEKSRARLKEIHQNSIKELEDGLAPELVDELERLSLPFADDVTPSGRTSSCRSAGHRVSVPTGRTFLPLDRPAEVANEIAAATGRSLRARPV